jgi:uncharacterized Ntn-hydrolase superfamily protein
MHRPAFWLAAFAFTLALAIAADPAGATFSITAVDPVTGEVGSAGASCISGSIILSDMHPGVGVIHTQSFYLGANQAYARSLMETGHSPQEIIDLVVENDAQGDPSRRQYAITDLVDGGRSAGYTGSNCIDYANHFLGTTFAVAGNILLGSTVLLNMEAAFTGTTGTLADKLMAALQGANLPGADTRCSSSGRPAISAFIRVARPDDPIDDLFLDLNVNNTSASENPIDILQGLYDEFVGTTAVPDARPTLDLAATPNPFRSGVSVTYDLPQATRIRAAAFDAVGRQVEVLFDGRQPAGPVRLSWSTDVAPGVYFIRIETAYHAHTARVVRVR